MSPGRQRLRAGREENAASERKRTGPRGRAGEEESWGHACWQAAAVGPRGSDARGERADLAAGLRWPAGLLCFQARREGKQNEKWARLREEAEHGQKARACSFFPNCFP